MKTLTDILYFVFIASANDTGGHIITGVVDNDD
jgi:hypothetical protein